MSPWLSLLPEQLSVYEVWLVRLFLFLGIITIGPWAALIVYDFLLYIWRTATYDLPYIGGRARGRPRPRAPSLSERPDGRLRTFSHSRPPSGVSVLENHAGSGATSSLDLGTKRRHGSALADD